MRVLSCRARAGRRVWFGFASGVGRLAVGLRMLMRIAVRADVLARMTVLVIVLANLGMAVLLLVLVGVLVRVFVLMAVIVIVSRLPLVPVLVAVRVAMLGTAGGVGAAFRFECFVRGGDDEVHALQHLCQHVIGFELQVIGFELQLHMAIAQVVGSAQQVERRAVLGAGPHDHHFLRFGDDADQRAILGHQHVAATDDVAARQEHPERAVLRVDCLEAAPLAHLPVELDGRGALLQHGAEAAALGQDFAHHEHLSGSRVPWGIRRHRPMVANTAGVAGLACGNRQSSR